MDSLIHLGHSLVHFMTFESIAAIFISTAIGVVVGALPGLTATMGVALMTTLTFKFESDLALLILVCTYVGAIYGGSRTAILINIPGTPANAATMLDGYPLAQQGLAGRAMGIATTGSVLGSVIGLLVMTWLTPSLADYALQFQSYEFFWLALFGVVISGQLTALDDPIKGWIAGFLGLVVAMVGQEGIHAYARFSYDSTNLLGGIALIPAMVGAFGLSEVLGSMRGARMKVIKMANDRIMPSLGDITKYWRTIIRSGILGTAIGIAPGVGEDVAAWVSYAAARRASKERHLFGKGSVEGLMAAETGNNAAVPGAIIPVLTLGIPGSAPAAVLLAAMFIHGVRPGPMIMIEFPDFVFDTVAMVFYATLGIGFYGITLTKPLIKILSVPRERLMPIVFVLCAVGSYAISQRMFDVWVMIFFGVLGYILREMKYPMAPLVLGIVLGDLLDKNLRRGLVLSDGDPTPFLTRPISSVLWIVTLLIILVSIEPIRRVLSSGIEQLKFWKKA